MAYAVHTVATPFGEIAYTESGEGSPALFVHGVLLNSALWRHVIAGVSDLRHCIAVDLLGHGATQTSLEQNLSWNTQADMLAAVCDALGFATIDLVGNDSGGGIAQIFAARYGGRLRSVTLTDCDVHDNCPPLALQPLVDASRRGTLGALGQRMLADPQVARQVLGVGYEHPDRVTDETLQAYLAPIFGTAERTRQFERLFDQWFVQMDSSLVEIEPALRTVQTPTLIVWGTDDVFFGTHWATWLHDTIPGARPVVMVEGGHLFFPEERPADLIGPLRSHWTTL